jgi:hypothetical protein
VTIGLNRQNGPGAGPDGVGRYIESVVVGPPGYYETDFPASQVSEL